MAYWGMQLGTGPCATCSCPQNPYHARAAELELTRRKRLGFHVMYGNGYIVPRAPSCFLFNTDVGSVLNRDESLN